MCVELEGVEEQTAQCNVATFTESTGHCAAVECVELQDMEQPSAEFSRLMEEEDASVDAGSRPVSRWRQIRALMKVRWLSERRMPTVWLVRVLVPVLVVVLGAVRWAVPLGLSTFSRFDLKPGYYVNTSTDNSHSTLNPGLALMSSMPPGLSVLSALSASYYFITLLSCRPNGVFKE